MPLSFPNAGGSVTNCGAANLWQQPHFRGPEPAESRLRAELPAPQLN
jgi:hypothetical protein